MRALLLSVLCACGADVPGEGPRPLGATIADRVLWAPGADAGPFGDPTLATNGVRGAGLSAGSTDVFSLAPSEDAAALALEWSDGLLVDGPGVDLVVYENPFEHASGVFFDPVIVEVSVDGIEWVPFPHDYRASDESSWEGDPDLWQGFAGLTPVLLNDRDRVTDPLNPEDSGGDGFDLALLGDSPEALDVQALGACCVRLWSASAWINPDSGVPYPKHPVGNGADIDGVYGRLD